MYTTILLYYTPQGNTHIFPLLTLHTNGWNSKFLSFNSSPQNPLVLFDLLSIISTLTKASFLVSPFSISFFIFFFWWGKYFIVNPHVYYSLNPIFTCIYETRFIYCLHAIISYLDLITFALWYVSYVLHNAFYKIFFPPVVWTTENR